jgi:hypothetical protein
LPPQKTEAFILSGDKRNIHLSQIKPKPVIPSITTNISTM